jgi:transposase
MRGRRNPQASMLAFVDLEERVPPHHPLRTIKRFADRALASLSPTFDAMYGAGGRPSIPPERLLKASLLISLYSVRSERAFCEELDFQLLWRSSTRWSVRRMGSACCRMSTSPSTAH